MGETGEKPMRRNNSYTSYTMAIYGIHGSLKEGEGSRTGLDGEKRRSRYDSYNSYCTAVADGEVAEGDGALAVEMADETVRRDSLEEEIDELEIDKPEVSTLFQFLQILTACFGSFAHGGNDVRYERHKNFFFIFCPKSKVSPAHYQSLKKKSIKKMNLSQRFSKHCDKYILLILL